MSPSNEHEAHPPALHRFVLMLDQLSGERRIRAAEAFLHVCRSLQDKKKLDAAAILETGARVTLSAFSTGIQ